VVLLAHPPITAVGCAAPRSRRRPADGPLRSVPRRRSRSPRSRTAACVRGWPPSRSAAPSRRGRRRSRWASITPPNSSRARRHARTLRVSTPIRTDAQVTDPADPAGGRAASPRAEDDAPPGAGRRRPRG
jgi:hypothetical protein